MIIDTQEKTRKELINERLTLRKEIVATLRVQKLHNKPAKKPIVYLPTAFRDEQRVNLFLGKVTKHGETLLLLGNKFKSFDKVHMNFLNTHRRNPSYKDAFTLKEIEEEIKENEVILTWDDLYDLKLKSLRNQLQLVVDLIF